ncbi:MAG: diguanylate cyclase [Chitinivibrionales bacterium]|nr:diguanylate cyclase [Chitinivibrionales bacterium]MBD3394910.1 diguanylate cyclase [Chitinivibrionales bacterium]
MKKPKTRWGIALFLMSPPLLAAAFYLVFTFKLPAHAYVHARIIPTLGIVFSALSFLVGHFSYPRVHNLKVYLAGYLTGLTGLAYFILFAYPSRLETQTTFVMLLVFANLLAVLLVPSYVKYRFTRRITYAIITLEAILLVCARYLPECTAWTAALPPKDLLSSRAVIGIGWAAAVFGLTLWRLHDEFYLGGIFTGVSLFYCLAWLGPATVTRSVLLQGALFAAAPLYLEIGIVIHWFLRMEHRASYDPLLHIYNRNYCSRIITEQSACNTAPPFSVAMVDIDHFKKVNDTYGHQAGDTVLYNVAQAIVREVVPQGVVCRYGGEEMVIFFPRKTARDVKPLVENLRTTIEKLKIPTRRKKLSVTVSCGISCREDTSQSVIDVIHAADKALYRAKKGGRNQVKSGKTPLASSKKK